MAIVQLTRDPFARATLLRDTLLHAGYKPCKWCGRDHARFIYGWCQDSVMCRPTPWEGPFCGVGCY